MFNVYVGHYALEWFKAIFLYREGKANSIKNKNKFLLKISSNECKERKDVNIFYILSHLVSILQISRVRHRLNLISILFLIFFYTEDTFK